jgi:hypothetical protein
MTVASCVGTLKMDSDTLVVPIFFFFFFFWTHFILEYKPEAKPSRNYEPLHL